MTYEDEKIAELKKEKRREQHRSITDGIYIDNRFVTFAPRTVGEHIGMSVPEDFIEMPEEVREMKYPSVNRPQVILTSLDTRINFAFNWIEESLEAAQMQSFLAQMKELIRRTNPAVKFYQDRQGQLPQGQPICMFDFKSYGMDEALYNMTAFAPTKYGVLQAVFNCPDRDSEDWQDAAWQAFQTIDTEAHEANGEKNGQTGSDQRVFKAI